MKQEDNTSPQLSRSLGPLMLWGLGVGYVISGMYFGWNLGLEKGGTLGLAIATFFVSIMYITFTLSYTELTCAIPRAGGVFVYATRAIGPKWGYVAGLTQIIEFVFAPPAISAAIASYLHLFFPDIHMLYLAIGVYFIFTGINMWGVKIAASFELFVTILAVAELIFFASLTLPHLELKNLTTNALPHGVSGIFSSIPFAIWFFLAIEGVANVAEETINPQKNMVKGFISAMMTLVFLCMLTFVAAVGVGGWESIVFDPVTGQLSDSPLPLALQHVVGNDHTYFHLLVAIGIFGLVASFHGIILAAGRATFEFGRAGLGPQWLGRVHPKTKTPVAALFFNMVIGIGALLTGKTGEIITLACLGAVTLYILATVSLFCLRKKEPRLERPFLTPFYPWAPIISLILAVICFFALTFYYPWLTLIYVSIIGCCFVLSCLNARQAFSLSAK